MSILFGLLLARRFYCRSALSLSPGRTGGLLPRINAPIKPFARLKVCERFFVFIISEDYSSSQNSVNKHHNTESDIVKEI